jgi:hypothetical protein
LRLLAAFETVPRQRLHPPAAQARSLRLRSGAAAAHPALRGEVVRRQRRSTSSWQAIVTQMRDYHTRYTVAGSVRRQGRGAAVPGRDVRARRSADLRRQQGRQGPRRGLRPRRAAAVLERRADRPRRRAPRRRGMRGAARRLALGIAAEPHLPLDGVRPAARRGMGRRRLPQERCGRRAEPAR